MQPENYSIANGLGELLDELELTLSSGSCEEMVVQQSVGVRPCIPSRSSSSSLPHNQQGVLTCLQKKL